MNAKTGAMLAIALTLFTAACVPKEHKAIAVTAVKQYHDRFNDSKFDEIYDDSTQELKAAISKKEFVESIRAMRKGEGRALKSEELSTDYRSGPDDVKIKLLMAVTFEKSQAREEFVYQISESKAVLSGYKFLGRY